MSRSIEDGKCGVVTNGLSVVPLFAPHVDSQFVKDRFCVVVGVVEDEMM